MLRLLQEASNPIDSIDTITEVIYGDLTPSEAIKMEMHLMTLEEQERVIAVVKHVHTTCENLLLKFKNS